jgi:hypothetical protein
MGCYLGFDPGGVAAFAWAVIRDGPSLPLQILASGVCDSPPAAVAASIAGLSPEDTVIGAAIDAPLLWARWGVRHCDVVVRKAIAYAGSRSPAGTVQSVNSLRGAFIAGGFLAAIELRERLGSIPISEAHPKALLWLCPEASSISLPTEHERDAAIGAFSAWAIVHSAAGWADLFKREGPSFTPIAPPLHYMMPISDAQQLADADPAGRR